MEKLISKRNPFKRAFSRFKRRKYGRKINTFKNPNYNMLKVKCEYMDTLWCGVLASDWKHTSNSATYLSYYSIMNQTTGFTGVSGEFDLYMITGASIEVMPSQHTASVSFAYGLPSVAVGCFPAETNATLGNDTFQQDSSVTQYFSAHSPARKYFSFPFGFMNGSTVGIGTWNKVSSYGSQQGQFSVCMPDVNTNNGSLAAYCFTVKYCIYITMNFRSR